MSEVILVMSDKMAKSVESLRKELSKVRTGRASLSIIDDISVDAYGSAMPPQSGMYTYYSGEQTDCHPAVGPTDAASHRKSYP